MKYTIGLLVIIAVMSAFGVAAEPLQANTKATETETGLTIITGTVFAIHPAGIDIDIYCQNADGVHLLAVDTTDNQGMFAIVHENVNLQCVYGDTVWAQFIKDNNTFSSPLVKVERENSGLYDYADVDIEVPEFGFFAALAVLAGAGLFIMRRRQ